MNEVIRLPADLRRCRRCGGDGMHAVGAARGGGWSGTGVRFLFRCPDCAAEAVFETPASRRTSITAGVLLSVACGLLLALAHPSPPAVAVLLVGVAGGVWLVWSVRIIDRRHPRTGTSVEAPRVEVEPDFPGEHAGSRRAAFLLAAIVAGAVLFLVLEAAAEEASDARTFAAALADFREGCECGPIVRVVAELAAAGEGEAAAAAATLYGWMANFTPRCDGADMLRPTAMAEALQERAAAMKEHGSAVSEGLPDREEVVAWETEALKYLWFMAPAHRGDPWALSLVVRGYALSGLDMITAYSGEEWREPYLEARERLKRAPRPSYAPTLGAMSLIASDGAWEAYKKAVLAQADKDRRHRIDVRSRPHVGLTIRAEIEAHPLVAAAGPEPETHRCGG